MVAQSRAGQSGRPSRRGGTGLCSRACCDQSVMSAVAACGSRCPVGLVNPSGPEPAPRLFNLLPPPDPSPALHSHLMGHVLWGSFAFQGPGPGWEVKGPAWSFSRHSPPPKPHHPALRRGWREGPRCVFTTKN